MKRRKRRENSRHSAKRKPLPLRIISFIAEYVELIILSIFYALMSFFLFIWDHKSQVLKLILTIIILVYCFFTSKYIIEMQNEFKEFKIYTENVNNELNSKNEENEKLQEEVDSTKTELESTQNELEALKESKAKQKEEEEKAEQIRIANANAARNQQVTSRSGSSISRTTTTSSTSSKSELQAYARDLCINTYGWSESDYQCLVSLWNRESGWNPNAHNSSSGAHGIPQSLPASKMASEGSDYYTNGKTQIRWGLKYIKNRYGTPTAAWSHSQSTGWY